MTAYRLAASRYRRVVQKDGKVVDTRRYYKGDTIEVEGEEEARLLAAGALLPLTDDETVALDEQEAQDGDEPQDGATDGSDDADPGDDEPGDDEPEPEDETEDDYDAMSYADLQVLAKSVTGNGGGSRDDLIARLREAADEA